MEKLDKITITLNGDRGIPVVLTVVANLDGTLSVSSDITKEKDKDKNYDTLQFAIGAALLELFPFLVAVSKEELRKEQDLKDQLNLSMSLGGKKGEA